jgi:hypothetical protein
MLKQRQLQQRFTKGYPEPVTIRVDHLAIGDLTDRSTAARENGHVDGHGLPLPPLRIQSLGLF